MPDPPGLLSAYPELRQTPSADVFQRTEWNVWDSGATLIVAPPSDTPSPGTEFTARCAERHARPCLVLRDPRAVDQVLNWLSTLDTPLVLNVAGPRESEAPGIYAWTKSLILDVLDADGP
jgi:hypothetical protein